MTDANTFFVPCSEELSEMAGDPRLVRRAQQLVDRWQRKPELGFPRIFNDAELEAAYRFFSNVSIDFDDLARPHAEQTAGRCRQFDEVLVIHDTTAFVFSGKREGLGFINKNNRGFLSHVTLAVAAQPAALPLGILHTQNWVRTKSRVSKGVPQHKLRETEDCESHRWLRGVEASEEHLEGHPGVVHLMDREGDIYDVIATMTEREKRFVVRASSNRCIESNDPDERLLFDVLEGLPLRYRKTIVVSPRQAARMPDQKRSNPAREGRGANVAVTATTVTLKRSRNSPGDLSAETQVNVVHVFETDCPENEKPVEWILTTTEPIETSEQIEAVVDKYRRRWLIEEFFKAIKTGCAFQKRQLSTYQALTNALALCFPVAWSLLLARVQSRVDEDIPAEGFVAPLRISLLRKKHKGLPPTPTLRDVAYAIARIGGHLKRNGPPGWLTLQRGFEELLILEEGAMLAMSMNTCDQS